MRGLVSEIQRFSVHDGPGIRTTVFLKGCNLQCRWCHNPETILPQPQLQVLPEKCIACGACLQACPRGAHAAGADGRRQFRRDLCQACGACAESCYAKALVLIGRAMTPQAVVDEILQDADFYRNSGGGMTLSGGEPLGQREFAIETLRLCRSNGLHTAVESNMCWPWQHVVPVLPLLDLVIMDIKVMDEDVHRRWTGQSNRHVLENARRLGRWEAPRGPGLSLIVRTPVVPGVNDQPEQIRAVAEFIAGTKNLVYYELLPYHPLGTAKYESLGMACETQDMPRPSRDTMRSLALAARQYGIPGPNIRRPDRLMS